MLKSIQPVSLCAQCIKHEINSWINEKIFGLNEETTQKIQEELKAIKLKQGKCIVCNNNPIADDCFENILKIMRKTKAEKEMIEEFTNMFGY